MQELVYLAFSLLGTLVGFLGATLAIKRYIKPEIILDFSDVLLKEIAVNQEYQQKLYLVGGLIGQGFQKGLGLPKATGKFKMEDMIGQLIAGFAQKALGQVIGPQQPVATEGIRKTL